MDRRRFLAALTAIAAAPTVLPSQPASRTRLGRRTSDIELGQIAYIDQGWGPAAIFVHAWPLNALEWRNVIPRLGKVRRCIAPDMLAFGATIAASGIDITAPRQADMILSLMDKLRIREADVVANDTGGLVAQILTAKAPNRVRSLLLTNCDALGDNPPPAFAPLSKLAAAGKLADLFVRPQLASLELARSARGIGSAFANPQRLTADLLQSYLAPLVSTPERAGQFNAFTASLGHDDLSGIENGLRGFTGPVRIVWGNADRLFSANSPEILGKLFPNSRGFKILPGAGIYVPEDQPDILADEALALWSLASPR